MGICSSSARRQQHVRVQEDGPLYPPHKKKRNKQKDDSSNDERIVLKVEDRVFARGSSQSSHLTFTSTTENTDATMPLSPDSILSLSSLLPAVQPQRLHFKGADTSTGADQPPFASPDSKHTPTSASVMTTKHHYLSDISKPGRALQQRLQKARYMQLATSSPFDGLNGSSGNFSVASAYHTRRPSSDPCFASSLTTRDPMLKTDATKPFAILSNDEFESSLNQGMIWAELDGGAPVLAVALSRQIPTLECSAPPLFLAMGTETGRVSVTEILDHAYNQQGARLGATMSLNQQAGRIRTLDFLPGEGNCLACGGDDGVCALIGLPPPQFEHNRTLRVLAEIPRLDRIYAAKFSPDGQFLAIGGYEATLAIVDVTSLTKPVIVTEVPVETLISTVAWSADGQFLAFGGSDKVCYVVSQKHGWQVVHDVRRSVPITTLEWHPQSNNRGRYHLAIGSSDVVVVNQDSFHIEQEISFEDGGVRSASTRINGLCWSPSNGKYMVVCGNNKRLRLLETKTFSIIQEIGHRSNINCVVWGQHTAIAGNGRPHQQYLALGSDDGKVLILKAGPTELNGDDTTSTTASSYFSTHTSSTVPRQNGDSWVLRDNAFRSMEDDSSETRPSPSRDDSLTRTVRAMAFSRGSKARPSVFFATASADGLVTVRSTVGFKLLCQLEFLDPITCIAFSNGSRMMACGSNDGKVRIVATAPVWTVAAVIDAETPVAGLSFSKNNERLAIIGNDRFLTLVNPLDHFENAGDVVQESTITAIDWSSKHLAAGQDDGIICIYDAQEVFGIAEGASLRVAATLKRPAPVRTLAFGANSRFLVVGGDEGILAVFSSASDWDLVHCIPIGFDIADLKWSPSGRHLAVTGGEPNMKKKQLRVVDTVFWANVDEVENVFGGDESSGELDLSEEVSPRRKNDSASLTFSQDGKLLAFNEEDRGTRVVSTSSWQVVFRLPAQSASLPTASRDESDASSLTLSRGEPCD